jgi:NADH dehydrogenase
MDDLLYVHAPPAGETKLSDWVRDHSAEIGVRYSSELARRTNRDRAYEEL